MLISKRLVSVSFWAWVILSLLRPIRNLDVWWHLATGRYILEYHQIPSVDVFSLTCRGLPWMNVEWLYQVMLYGVYHLSGIFGIVAFKAAFIIAALVFLIRRLRQSGVPDFGIILCAMIVFAACRPGWTERADLVSICLVSALMMSLESVRKGLTPSKNLANWVAIFFVWANAHAGFVVGLGIAGLYALEFIRLRRISLPRSILWFGLLLLVSCATPLGISLWKEIIHCLTKMPSDISDYVPPPWSHMAVFWMAFLLFMLVCFSAVQKKFHFSWVFWILSFVLGFEAISHARYVPFFMFAAFPSAVESIFARDSTRTKEGWQGILRHDWLSLLLIAMAAFQLPRIAFGVPRREVPVDVCDFIASHHIGGRFYNDYDFGGYWIWRFAGNPAVFIDGRFPTVEGYTKLRNEIAKAQHGSPRDWQNFMDRYRITAVVIRYPEPAVRNLLFTSYFPKSRWTLVYQDDLALLFLKQGSYSNLHLESKVPVL